MERQKLPSEAFVCLQKVSEVSERVRSRNVRGELGSRWDTAFFHGKPIRGDLEVPVGRIRYGMPSESRGEHAVEHIDTAIYSLYEVFGSSNAHEIVRLAFRKLRSDNVENAEHVFLRFPDG